MKAGGKMIVRENTMHAQYHFLTTRLLFGHVIFLKCTNNGGQIKFLKLQLELLLTTGSKNIAAEHR